MDVTRQRVKTKHDELVGRPPGECNKDKSKYI